MPRVKKKEEKWVNFNIAPPKTGKPKSHCVNCGKFTKRTKKDQHVPEVEYWSCSEECDKALNEKEL
jgi:hypothetical protein